MSATEMTSGALIAPRCCGRSRTDGGIYAESGLSPWGMPLEFFFVDPPVDGVFPPGESKGQPIPILQGLNLSARGVQVIEYQGVPHLFDVVGAEHYPDVADFIEETRTLGASRRCELPASEYARLLPNQSRMIMVHPRATALNFDEYFAAMSTDRRDELDTSQFDCFLCPKGLDEHRWIERDGTWRREFPDYVETMCAGLWNFDLTPHEGMDELTAGEPEAGVVAVRRTLPAGQTFDGFYRNEKIEDKHVPAIFLSLPITRLVLVDPEGKHSEKHEKLSGSKIEWEVTPE